jgi:hypothetical protein
MRVRFYSVHERKRQKAEERAADRLASEAGHADGRQKRNRFIPNAKEWVIEKVAEPLQGHRLD